MYNIKLSLNKGKKCLVITILDRNDVKRVGQDRFSVPKTILDVPYYITCIMEDGMDAGRQKFYKTAKLGEGFSHWCKANKKFKKG